MTNAEIIAIVRRAKFKVVRGGKGATSDNNNRPKLRAFGLTTKKAGRRFSSHECPGKPKPGMHPI
jgi:hypothetical protein